jgi:site-specific recombinase XerD
MNSQLGAIVQGFFAYYLVSVRGLSPASIRSYRDAIRLFLLFMASMNKTKVSKLELEELSFECVLAFLDDLEKTRKNRAQTRNQRLAALHVFYEYVAAQVPEMLAVCQRVAAIPRKRARRQEVIFLERDEVTTLIQRLPARGVRSLRDRALILLLYNTGARVDEVAQLRVEQLELKALRVRLLGKGGKWRTCPLWKETAQVLVQLIEQAPRSSQFVFLSRNGPLTRFGIYKIVRRHSQFLDRPPEDNRRGKVSPHVFRHTTAVHLLESGVELNVIRGWLGHADISSTQHYAEINTRAKEAALRACDPVATSSQGARQTRWRNDEKLLSWLASL